MIIDKFIIQTLDSIAMARDKLTRQVEAMPLLFRIRSHRVRLCGGVSSDNFSLCRVDGSGQSMTIINCWFEVVQSGTLVHLEVNLNLNLVIFRSFFSLCSFIAIAYFAIKVSQLMPAAIASLVIVIIVSCIYSCQDEMRFYRKKLSQIFL
jgi:Mn2+/Fe2+ NRAMP family transporter